MAFDTTIIELTPELIGSFRELVLRALELEPTAFARTCEAERALPESEWRKWLPSAQASTFCSLHAGTLVGYARYKREDQPKKAHNSRLIGFYVDPAFRRKSHGDMLLQHCLTKVFQQPDTRAITLTVTETELAARRLYERMSFRVWGVEPEGLCVAHVYYTNLHMRLDRSAWLSLDATWP